MRASAGDRQLAAGDEGADRGGGAEAEELGDGFGGEEGGGIGVVHCGVAPFVGRSVAWVGAWGNLFILAKQTNLSRDRRVQSPIVVSVGPLHCCFTHASESAMTSSIFPSDLLDTSFKAIAPLAVDTDWLGHEIRDDFVGVKTTLFIKAPHKKLKRQEFNLSWSALQSDYAVRAAYSGFGISLAAASGESKRAAVYSAYEISTIDEIDTTQAFMVPHQNGFTPVRIYRGWSLNVLVEGESSNFSLEAAAGLLGARARVEAQAAQWSARAKFNLRGLKRKNSNAIVIPRDIDDIKADFEVDGDNPAPIFVEYVMVGSPLVRPISWANFRAPEFWAFDGQWAQYRVYRDPRVPPGQLSLDISNPWPYDWAVFEIWRPGTGQHSYRWELGAGQMHRGDQIPLPDYPLQLVWVGHKTLVENAALDPNFGWRLDFVRTR